MKKIYIIDGNSLINRAFYALPLLSNSDGVFSNAVFGFVNCVVKLITEQKPDYMVVAFDHARKTFRNEIYSEYKGTRKPAPAELLPQFDILKQVLSAMNIKCIEQAGIEADDIIGTIVKKSKAQNYIITGDRDALQLVDKNTCVWLTQKGITDIKEVNLQNIQELYELTPSQIIEYKALSGDASDNIPGVAGVGTKTAITLLKEYDNVENIYKNIDQVKGKLREKLEQGKDVCFMSKKLATINTECEFDFELQECTFDYPFNDKVKKLFEKYNFNSLLKKESLFSKMDVGEEQKIIALTSLNDLKNIICGYKGEQFAFDVKKDFEFCIDNVDYVVKKQDLGIDDDSEFYSLIAECLMPILQNDRILKLVQDLKLVMHKLNTKIHSVFDVNLANYLVGGGSPFKSYSCIQFSSARQELCSKMQDEDLFDLYSNIELPLEYVLFDMENDGFAIDRQTLLSLEENYKQELLALDEQIVGYSSNKTLNIRSPKQVASFLFDELGLSDKFNKKHSTNVDALAGLVDEHPVVSLILRHRKVAKLYSTYLEPYEKMTNGLNSSIIHTVFNQTLTTTGRLSSSEPNLQNIPVRDAEGKNLRKMFISRFDGGKLISADYNQIELRLLANFSGDGKLIEDYNNGADVHASTASKIFNVPTNCVTDYQRRLAKAVNFGIIYGISGFGLAKNIDVPVKEAKQYIDVYFEQYPVVKEYLDGLVQSAKALGYSKTLFNRRRYIPELASSNGLQKTLGERLAMNMPLQGSASDIIKLAMLNVHKRFIKDNIKSKLILQIHDELIVDTYPGEEQIVTNILTQEMQNAYVSKVPLLVAVGIGKTWYDCK